MRHVLVLYATREGQTAKVAGRIAGRLRAEGAIVELADAKSTPVTNLSRYELLVFGASLHAGGLEAELVRFVNAHAVEIGERRRAFFLVLLSAATRDPALRERWLADARAKVDEQLQVRFDDVEMIAGALAYSKYPLPLKWMMQRIARKAGGDTDTSRDYEYTDWARVDDYARRLLTSGASPGP